MTFSDRMERWNRWYDTAPEEWRFQMVAWPVVAIGAINMALTIAVGFPFGLLLLIAIAAVAAVRVPHMMGWIKPATAHPGGARFEIGSLPWVYSINRWYDGIPELRRPWVILVVLAVAGAINMVLTINHGFSFGLLFLIALLVMAAIRGPYVAGWLTVPPSHDKPLAVVRPHEQIQRDATIATPVDVALASEPPPEIHHPTAPHEP